MGKKMGGSKMSTYKGSAIKGSKVPKLGLAGPKGKGSSNK